MSKKTNRKKTILFLLAVFVLVNIFARGPDLIGAINQPPDRWYTGQASWFDPWDINQYFAVIGWGKRNGILFENLYDTEAGQGVPIYSFYTLWGRVVSFFHLPNALAFHLAGVLASFSLLGIIWWFLGIFLEKETERRIALFFLFLGGGFGWLVFPKTILPDLGLPGLTLTTAIRRPHEAISLSLFLLSLGGFWQATAKLKNRAWLSASLTTLLMAFFHPHNLFIIGVVFLSFGIYWWIIKGATNFFKPLFLVGLAGGVYFWDAGREFLINPSFSGLASQIQPSYQPMVIALGWGLLFPLALASVLAKGKNKKTLFITIWLACHWLIIYLPFSFQKLLIRGLFVPVVILATKGISEISRQTKWNYQKLVWIILILSSLSTLLIFLSRLVAPSQNRWTYLTRQEGEIIDYLSSHGNNEEGVLASYRIANIIPANTKKRIWAGHRHLSPNFDERIVEVNKFFSGEMTRTEAQAFLAKTRSVWVFWGPEEKEIGNLSEVPYQSLLEPVIENPIASLYQVK